MAEKLSYTVNKYYVKITRLNDDTYDEEQVALSSSYDETVQVPKVNSEEKKRVITEVAQRLAGMNYHALEAAKREGTGFYYKLILSKFS
jgi:hypothetical protein